ncbi:MAG: peptidylprolyl isomerase, partial [Zoogloea sp.]|nr:peptidylprolyl isomerase [Zoogloea sp.]
IAARASAERVLAVQLEERDISQVVLAGKQFESQVKLADGAAKGFYDTNRKRFELPAQVRADFLVLNQDALADQVTVSDAEAKKWYDEHPERYRQGEERRASHILILADKSAPEAAHKAAREKAEALLKQARANPAAFATLAKANSQDPGSAQNGGDLGFFARGAMVKAFEDVAFALKDGQISDVVRSDYGYHIIKLTGIKASKAQPFEAVKGDILTELKRVQAGKKFAELAETFSNTVYEQADSLKPAADKFKLAIQHTGWIARGAQVAPPFNNEKLITALFSEDALKNKRNTDAVDVGNNTLVAARVAEYKPATLRPFEEVKADIERMLVAEEAAKLAAKDGAAKLASLQKGDKLELAWTEGRKLQRGAPSLPPEAMRAVFSAPADKLPAYTGLNLPGAGYVLFRIEKVNHPAVQESDPRLQAIRTQYGRLLSDQDFSAYMSALRQRYGVKIDKAQLESKEK